MTTIAPKYGKTEIGTIQLAPEVVEVIAGIAAAEVRGVAGMSGGFAGGIAELIGRKNYTKGVNVQINGSEAAVDVSVVVEYGFRIPELAEDIQSNVKNAIESMTGITVTSVNIHIHDVLFSNVSKEQEAADPPRVK